MVRSITIKHRLNATSKFETCLVLTEHALKMLQEKNPHCRSAEALIDYLFTFCKAPENFQAEILYQPSKSKKNLPTSFGIEDAFIFPIKESEWLLRIRRLTGQEKKVFSFIIRNYKQHQICEILNIKLNTEKGYRKLVHEKMEVSDFSAISDIDRDLLLRFTNEKDPLT
jgi:hypothetical protein